MDDCLKDLVGVSQIDCSCYGDSGEANSPANLYYLDSVINLKLAEWIECGDDSMWSRLVRTKQRAIQNFKLDFDAYLRESHFVLNNYNGTLGDPLLRDAVVNSQFRGFRIKSKNLKGSYLSFNQLEFYSTNKATYQLNIVTSDGLINKTIDIEFGNDDVNKWVSKTIEPVTIPLFNDYEDEPMIYIYWNNPDAGINKRNCPTCSGKLPFDSYYTIDGIHSDNPESWSFNEYQHGIRLKVDTTCGPEFGFCNASTYGKAHLAVAIAHRWAVDIIDDILRDPEPNKWTMLGLEELAILRKSIMKSDVGDSGPYYSNIRGAASHLNFGACFRCSPVINKSFISR